ncbi:hypothetical protein ACFWP2_13885 [Kitasatospora sp. NPDC058444]|uniref:hypothetical protein n=1 Tax=Kitasatospora sp. NPDC058444 TaxID=3346504 RepID=UPI003646C3BE
MPPEVGRAWQALRRSHGAPPVAGPARESGWSARHLQDRFRRETGLPPKTAARVMRVDRARRPPGARPAPARRHRAASRLAEPAVRCG